MVAAAADQSCPSAFVAVLWREKWVLWSCRVAAVRLRPWWGIEPVGRWLEFPRGDLWRVLTLWLGCLVGRTPTCKAKRSRLNILDYRLKRKARRFDKGDLTSGLEGARIWGI